mmetsp:Transcript_19475/g.32716  ORF Transcript_19475/g.32716 Transcript_19475/m.32716 type:complete len:89 (-) Transcript_19475:165-431(-)
MRIPKSSCWAWLHSLLLLGCGSHCRVVSDLGQWFRSSALHFCQAADTWLEAADCGQMDQMDQMAERYSISGGSKSGSSSMQFNDIELS